MSTTRSMLHRNHAMAMLLFATSVLFAGCYEQKQTATLNPDGSGKVLIETDVAVPAIDAPGRQKPTALTFGRQYAADIINGTRGVDVWADVAVSAAPDGRAHIQATAYFKDINRLRFDMPLEFHWDRDIDGATFSIQRTRTAVNTSSSMSDADVQKLVAKAKSQYNDQEPTLRTQLTGFKVTLTFLLPGELDSEHLLSREGNSVTLVIDGKKAADALDKFMADDAALATTFKRGKDTSANDDIMLKSMYGQVGPVQVHSKFRVDEKPQFDYKTEATVAELRQTQMFKDAGVDLVPEFIVKDPQTAPAATLGK